MFLDAFTIAGILVALALVAATLWSTGCCRKRR